MYTKCAKRMTKCVENMTKWVENMTKCVTRKMIFAHNSRQGTQQNFSPSSCINSHAICKNKFKLKHFKLI